MEEQLIKIKRSIRISAAVVIISCAALIASNRIDTIRAVDFLQIFISGVGFGVLLVNILLLKRLKSKQQE